MNMNEKEKDLWYVSETWDFKCDPPYKRILTISQIKPRNINKNGENGKDGIVAYKYENKYVIIREEGFKTKNEAMQFIKDELTQNYIAEFKTNETGKEEITFTFSLYNYVISRLGEYGFNDLGIKIKYNSLDKMLLSFVARNTINYTYEFVTKDYENENDYSINKKCEIIKKRSHELVILFNL